MVSTMRVYKRCRYCLVPVYPNHKFAITFSHIRDVVMYSVYDGVRGFSNATYYWSSSFMTLAPGIDDGCPYITLEERHVYEYTYPQV